MCTSSAVIQLICMHVYMYMHVSCICNFAGDEWHLRRTNWCGEAAEILDDEVTMYTHLILWDKNRCQGQGGLWCLESRQPHILCDS